MFLFWCIVTVIYNQLSFSWIISFMAFILMIIPITFNYNAIELDGFKKYVIAGFLLTLPFAIYDIAVTIYDLPPFGLNSYFFDYSNSGIIGGFYRVRATFDEPSFYAIYLCLIFYFINSYKFKYNTLLIIINLILIILTLSLTGIFIMFFLIYYKYLRGRIFIKIKPAILLLFIILCMFLISPNFYQNISYRIKNTILAFTSFRAVGSEESRINSFPVLIDYYNSSDGNIIFGEGYSNYEKWLQNNYSHLGRSSSFARGTIHNAFGVVGISTGIIGLLIYILIFVNMGLKKIVPWDGIILHGLIQLSYTLMIGYLFWGIVLFLIANEKQKKIEYSSLCC
jgi:hypothetical protein